MNIVNKLINILKIHAELADRYAKIQLQFRKDKEQINPLLKPNIGKYEKNYNRQILRTLQSYHALQRVEVELSEFWDSLEPELTNSLSSAIDKALELATDNKTLTSLQKYKLNLDLGRKTSANAIKQIVSILLFGDLHESKKNN